MRNALLLSFVVVAGSSLFAQAPAQTPRPPQPAPPTQTRPAPTTPAPAPAPRRPAAAPAAAARTGMAITATDDSGKPIGGVRITISGPSERSGTTDTSGMLRVTGLMVGTYRLRFAAEEIITFEREVAVRSGQTADIDVTLSPAPPEPEAPPPPPAPVVIQPPVGPAGQPMTTSLTEYLRRNQIGNNEPRRETVVSCSGNTRMTLVQMNESQSRRLYDTAEVTYYVLQGEGSLKVDDREGPLAVGSVASVPRATGHELIRRGRRPLIVLVTVSGSPCEEAK